MAQNPFDQLSKQYLEEFLAPIDGKLKPAWPAGIYFLPDIFKTAIVAIANQNPI